MVKNRNSYRFLYIHRLVYIHIFICSVSSEGPEAMISQWGQAYLVPAFWFLTYFPIKRTRENSLNNWLILGMGQEIHKMILEHLLVPESKEVLRSKQNPTMMRVCQRDTRVN